MSDDAAYCDLQLELDTAQQELKNVYRERAHLVAILAAFVPATLSYTDPSTPDWPVLTLDGGEGGQLSWHIAPDDIDLFPHIPITEEGFAWDGHSTEEKYERLRDMTAVVSEMMSVLNVAGLPDLLAAAVDEAEREAELEPEHTSPKEPELVPAHMCAEYRAENGTETCINAHCELCRPTPATAPMPKKTTTSRAKKAGA